MRPDLFLICFGFYLCAASVYGNEEAKRCFGRNEELKCVNECPPERTCNNRDIKFSCFNNDKKCQQKCVCKDGFYRSSLGECISRANCERCTGEHEHFACGGFCDDVCSELHRQNKTSCPVVNIVCNEKCYCDDGYARDDDDKCIPIEHCKKPAETCGPNEEYQKCKILCPPDTCSSLLVRHACGRPRLNPQCVPGCACQEGFLKHEGSCIPIRECPQLASMPGYK